MRGWMLVAVLMCGLVGGCMHENLHPYDTEGIWGDRFLRPSGELQDKYVTSYDLISRRVGVGDPQTVGHIEVREYIPRGAYSGQKNFLVYDMKWIQRGFVTELGHTYQYNLDGDPVQIGVYPVEKGAMRILNHDLAGLQLDLVTIKRDYTRDPWEDHGPATVD